MEMPNLEELLEKDPEAIERLADDFARFVDEMYTAQDNKLIELLDKADRKTLVDDIYQFLTDSLHHNHYGETVINNESSTFYREDSDSIISPVLYYLMMTIPDEDDETCIKVNNQVFLVTSFYGQGETTLLSIPYNHQLSNETVTTIDNKFIDKVYAEVKHD